MKQRHSRHHLHHRLEPLLPLPLWPPQFSLESAPECSPPCAPLGTVPFEFAAAARAVLARFNRGALLLPGRRAERER